MTDIDTTKPFIRKRVKKYRTVVPMPTTPCHACYRPHTRLDAYYCAACIDSGGAGFHQKTTL